MKFENPTMNISMFEVEDVITTSGGETFEDAQSVAAQLAGGVTSGNAGAVKVVF